MSNRNAIHSQKRSPSLTWSVLTYATSSVQLQNSTFSFAYCFLDRFILWTNFKMNVRVMLSFIHQADLFFFDHITLFLQFVFFCWSNFNLVDSFAITRTTTNLYGRQNIVFYQQHILRLKLKNCSYLFQYEEEIERLKSTGIRTKTHTVELCRLMVRVTDLNTKTTLASLIRTADNPCRWWSITETTSLN
jgi:hypothetical protein